MKREEFIEKYNHLFANEYAHPAVSDGWLGLLNLLCSSIDRRIDDIKKYNDIWLKNDVIDKNKHINNSNFIENFKIVQIKEKFGGLRFYVEGCNDELMQFIHSVEIFSYYICEECGTTENIGKTIGWVRTICKKCAINKGKIKEWSPKEGLFNSNIKR